MDFPNLDSMMCDVRCAIVLSDFFYHFFFPPHFSSFGIWHLACTVLQRKPLNCYYNQPQNMEYMSYAIVNCICKFPNRWIEQVSRFEWSVGESMINHSNRNWVYFWHCLTVKVPEKLDAVLLYVLKVEHDEREKEEKKQDIFSFRF